MIELSPTQLAALALFCSFWLAAGSWALLTSGRRSQAAASAIANFERSDALLGASPAMPLIVGRKGALAGHERLSRQLGLDPLPQLLPQMHQEGAGLAEEDLQDLVARVAEMRKSGGSYSTEVRRSDGAGTFMVEVSPAPPAYEPGTVLLWFIEMGELAGQRAELQDQAQRLGQALDSLSALIEAAPLPMWYRGPDLRLAMVNSAYVRAVEGGDAMAVVKSGIELVDESDGRSPLSLAAAVRETGEPIARTIPATIAGERRMMSVVEVPIGETGVAGYAIDVEDREQARADLARFVRAQRDMLDRLSAGVAQFGRDRNLTFFNQPFVRLFSLRSDLLAENPEFNRVLDAMREGGNLPEVRDYPEWKEERGGWFTSGLTAAEEDWLLPGGKHLRVVAQPLPDGGLLLIFEDRTEQIQLASARDTLLRVRTATFDNLFEAVGVFASDGRLHLWNNRFRALWNFDEEHLATHPRVDALTPLIAKQLKNPGHAGMVRELVRSATVERKQRAGRVSLKDGREFEFAAVPLPDGNALFAMLDVTASRTVEAALRERTDALEEADRLKTAFVSNMSYELRTPLTSIGGFAEMLAAGYAGDLSPTAADYVKAILDSVARLGTLIDNVLDLTQSDSGSLLLAEDQIELEALCRSAAEAVRQLTKENGIELSVKVRKSAGLVVGDARRLRQAIENVARNAADQMQGKGRILIAASGDEASAEIVVSDNGPGIPASEQTRVFDRFYRTMVTGEGRDGTLGLGLPLAKQFVEAHGGTITLQSEAGAGTTVTIRLPRKQG